MKKIGKSQIILEKFHPFFFGTNSVCMKSYSIVNLKNIINTLIIVRRISFSVLLKGYFNALFVLINNAININNH